MTVEVHVTNKAARLLWHGWNPATRQEAERYLIDHAYGRPNRIKRDEPTTTLYYTGFCVDITTIDAPHQALLF
jgi:hypothetical protein